MLALDLEDTLDPPTSEEAPIARRPSEPLVAGDRYQLGETIARGGMGEVITAHDADIGRDVAIKRLRAPNPTPIALARFLREARIQGRLDHPAIVPVHELACDDENRPFFAMKKLSGTTLAAIFSSSAPQFTRHQLLRAFADVCLAIEFAHTRGVIHRDIKPANILLGDFGEVYVLDWGIARVPTDRADPREPDEDRSDEDVWTRPGSALGTPGYMAPEQARGDEVDARTDVYALGCVLFEILAGSPLHPRGKEAIRSTLRGIDARPSLRAADVPPELDGLCVHATALDPNERIASARALGDALQRYLDGDRDVELRSRLAREHLAVALVAGDDGAGRHVAMREAAQALALDPTLAPAAELVGRLMLEPPTQVPEQVQTELADADRTTVKRFMWNLVVVHVGYLVFLLPAAYALGIRDLSFGGLQAIISVIGLAAAIIDIRTGRDLTWIHNLVIFASSALLARAFTPFLFAPVGVAVNTVAFAFHPRGRDPRAFLTFMFLGIASILGVWFCEAVGVLSPTMIFAGGTLVLQSPLDGMAAFPLEGALCVFVPFSILGSSSLAFVTARVAWTARDRMHVHAWHVRQLVPDRRPPTNN